MTQAPSIKEALELKPCPFCNGDAESDSQRHYRNISTGNLEKSAAIYCTKCSADMTWCYRDTPEIEREQVMVLLTEQWNTRATLPPAGERREAIARIIEARASVYDGCNAVYRGSTVARELRNILDTLLASIASGLVQDEASIRADEREKCAKIADLFVNHDAEYGAKYPDEAFKFDNRWLRSKTIADAIRSARDGGEG